MRRILLALLLLLLAWGALSSWRQRAVSHPPGVLVADPPRQVDLPHGAVLRRGDFTLTTRARFDVTARVLSRSDYTWDDGAKLVPTDLALGWGRMSDSAVVAQLDISQSLRFYHVRFKTPPIPLHEMQISSANMHLIPADDSVQRAIQRVRPGQVVHVQGFLVDARRSDGWQWNTSLTRADTGNGACELVYVESIGRGAL